MEDPFAPSAKYLAWLDSLAEDYVAPKSKAGEDTPRQRANGVPKPQRTGQVPRWLAPPLPVRFTRPEGTLR